MAKVPIVFMGVEGGGGKVYGEESDGVWSFWWEGTWMEFDENDDEVWPESRSDPVLELALALPDSWSTMFPVEIHPEFVGQLRELYEHRIPSEFDHHNQWRWRRLLGCAGEDDETGRDA